MKLLRRIVLTIKAYFFWLLQKIYNHTPYCICTWMFRHIDYFHYKALVHFEHPILTKRKEGGIIGNECYGNLWAVKNAMKEGFHPNCMIEHGVYFGEYVIENECTIPSIDTIYTYSEYRKKAILKWFDGKFDKKIVTVGPYILYADNFKTKKQLRKIKAKLGRVLLVFPSHPFPGQKLEYNIGSFQKEIEDVAKDFDTVLVSLGYEDVRKGNDKIYLNKGYKVVCSGGRMDRWFLCRLHDLLELSDMSMSNDVGTHIGYSVAMGVPHYLFKQKVISENVDGSPLQSDNRINSTRKREYDKLYEVFSSKEPIITQNQKEMVNFYWGLDKTYK